MELAYHSAVLRPAALILTLLTTDLCGWSGTALHTPICVIAADSHHRGTLLAGTATARLFRSRDGGTTWSPLPFPAESRSTLHAIAIDPNVDAYWVAVTSETSNLAGLFRSADEGVTWQPVPGLKQKQVWALAFWNVDPHVMAAGTEEGVYLTRDGGRRWTLLGLPGSAGPRPVVSLAFNPMNANVLYAGTPHLAWKTVDGGSTWHPIDRGMKDDSDIFALDIDTTHPLRVFAASCGGIYRSLDGGRTWSSLERAEGGPVRTYVVTGAPDRPHVVYAGTSAGLIMSPDSGVSWYRLSSSPARAVIFDPEDPHRVLVATDEGVLRIDDRAEGVLLTAGATDEQQRLSCADATGGCRPVSKSRDR